MDDNPEWFSAKRYGCGAGLPIKWQGWVVTGLYLAIVFGAAFLFRDHPLLLGATIAPATLMFMLICARTTRGGWHWRWGDPD